MKTPRILGTDWARWAAAVVACLAHVTLGFIVWHDGALLSLATLVVFSCAWVILCTLNGTGWRRTLNSWRETLADWKETSALARDYASLLTEALGKLSTYDQDEAMEIMGRASTIGLLRQQNFDERKTNE